MKQKRSRSNQTIINKNRKIIRYNFLKKNVFKNEVFNDFIQNIKKKHIIITEFVGI